MSLGWITPSFIMVFRIIAITLGGYGLTTALSALSGMLLHTLGASLSEAMLTTVMLGYLFYTGLLMWGFAERTSLRRPWLILSSAAITMVLASLLAPALLAS